jgi:hypothetical protein
VLLPPENELLVEALRELPRVRPRDAAALAVLLETAEQHGVAGVLHGAHRDAGVALPPDLERRLSLRAAAREADHAAHVGMLHRIDGALAEAGLEAVALKGVLLGARLYARPSVRPTTDIDLLVAEGDLERAGAALVATGYRASDDPAEELFRRWGHHLHFAHPEAPPVELHFHAYRGFGGVLRSEPLLARSVPAPEIGSRRLARIRVLAADDELVFLATHAAAHRFIRLGWLYDLLLLLRSGEHAGGDPRVEPLTERATIRARELGMSRPLALALGLAGELFGWRGAAGIGQLGGSRRLLLRAITREPPSRLARGVTRFAYSLALAEDWSAAGRYARSDLAYRWRLATRRLAGRR